MTRNEVKIVAKSSQTRGSPLRSGIVYKYIEMETRGTGEGGGGGEISGPDQHYLINSREKGMNNGSCIHR